MAAKNTPPTAVRRTVNAASARLKKEAERAKQRAKSIAVRAKESSFVAKTAGGAGAFGGALVGSRFARRKMLMANPEKKDPGIDAMPLVGAIVGGAGMAVSGPLGAALTSAGLGVVGGSLGTTAALKSTDLLAKYDEAIAAAKK